MHPLLQIMDTVDLTIGACCDMLELRVYIQTKKLNYANISSIIFKVSHDDAKVLLLNDHNSKKRNGLWICSV